MARRDEEFRVLAEKYEISPSELSKLLRDFALDQESSQLDDFIAEQADKLSATRKLREIAEKRADELLEWMEDQAVRAAAEKIGRTLSDEEVAGFVRSYRTYKAAKACRAKRRASR